MSLFMITFQVFQRRHKGEVDFYRTWDEYETGFGDLLGEYWLGNKNIHLLTKVGNQHIKFQLGLPDGTMKYAEYSQFSVEDESDNYRLSIGGYVGDSTAGESHN